MPQHYNSIVARLHLSVFLLDFDRKSAVLVSRLVEIQAASPCVGFCHECGILGILAPMQESPAQCRKLGKWCPAERCLRGADSDPGYHRLFAAGM